MNLLDYPKFFSSVTKAFIQEPGFYEYFIRHGFDPNEWPEVNAKTLAVKFHETVKQKSIQYAQLSFAKKADGLESSNLSEDANSLICAFSEFKTYGLGRELGQAILSQPSKANELLEGFKHKKASGVVVKNFKEEIAQYVEHEKLRKENVEKEIIINAWPLLSQGIGGFNPGRVILVVAGTGVGKTTLSLNLILSALEKMPVLFFNMEMTFQDIYDRVCMIGAGLSSYQWKNLNNHASVTKTAEFISKIYGMNDFLITDGRSLTIEQITNEIYSRTEKNKVKLVFVDYDQKIRTKYQGEEWQTLQKAVEELEETAKATQTCVVVLSQGDENNLPKASKRSMQSASAVLAFYQNEQGEYIIEAKKNRFGRRNLKLKVNCDFEYFKTQEAEEYRASENGPSKGIFNVAKKI